MIYESRFRVRRPHTIYRPVTHYEEINNETEIGLLCDDSDEIQRPSWAG